jgi:hypothetical protein
MRMGAYSFTLTARIRVFGFIYSKGARLYKEVEVAVSSLGADFDIFVFYIESNRL